MIADTDPAAYTSGVVALSNKPPKGAMRSLSTLFGSAIGQTRSSGNLVYGTFTFTNNYGTHVGYSTPDFRQFAIPITVDCTSCR